MSTRRALTLSAQILDEATTWFVEFSEGELARGARQEFIQWLRTSPEHVRAYLQVAAHFEDARALGSVQSRTVEELIALARADGGNVVGLEARASMPAIADSPPTRSAVSAPRAVSRRHYLTAAAGLAAVGMTIAVAWWLLAQGVYSTDTGEERSLTLADGSTVELNARSKIRVVFHPHERDIELLQGQALFKVAKDTARPFIVKSGDTQVRAVGTAFDVYRKTAATVVTVIEGRVAVLPPPQASRADAESAGSVSRVALPPAVLVSAGQQVTVTARSMTLPKPADTAAATAWTQKQMIFASTPLSEVVAEFNRYNIRQLIITDPSIAGIRISGVFSSTDPTSLLRGLEAQGKFTVRESQEKVEIMAMQ